MPLREQIIDEQGRAYATGRRKDAVARVWIKPGTGKITVNGRDQEVYFARPTLRLVINQVFGITERDGQYDVVCTVKGGGLSGQAGAVKHGISQALTRYEPIAARAGQGRRLPDPRQPRGRAQEVRQGQGPPQLPVLEALSTASTDCECGNGAEMPRFLLPVRDGRVDGLPAVPLQRSISGARRARAATPASKAEAYE